MDDLTKKQKGFVKDYIETGNGVQSALNNYDTDDYSTAGNIASDNLNKPKIQIAIKSIAESIPDELLVEKHLELLNASNDKGSIDSQAVGKGLDMAYKIKGTYAPEKSINLEINVTDEDTLAKAEAFNEWYKQQRT